MSITKSYIAAIALGVILASCAKAEPEDITQLEQKSLDAWIEKYVKGQGIDVVRQSNGMWVEFIEDGRHDAGAVSGKDTVVWVQLHYTSTDIYGNVFATRDSTVALQQRTYTPRTYYSPEYLYCGDLLASRMPEGQHFALTGGLVKSDGSTVALTEGARVKLYIPSNLAYTTNGFSNDQGYGGQYPLGSTKIMVQDLTVKSVIKNPLEHEEALVQNYAVESWGKQITDTLAVGFYVDTINFRPRADLLAKYPNKEFNAATDSLGLDSTAMIWYVGRFLPTPEYPRGFIFETNIPEIYEEFYNRRKGENYIEPAGTYKAMSYKPSDGDEGVNSDRIAAFYRAVPELRKGQWSRILFTSSYGYGSFGLSKAVKEYAKYNQQLMQNYLYSSMYSSYGSGYGYGYGSGYGGYGGGYYGNYYDPYNSFYGYNNSGYSEQEDEQTITTEVPPYTPLMYEIYIEAGE